VLTGLEAAHVKILLAGSRCRPTTDRTTSGSSSRSSATWLPNTTSPSSHDLQGPDQPDRVIQQDGIHPTAKGSEIIANTLLSVLKPLLHK